MIISQKHAKPLFLAASIVGLVSCAGVASEENGYKKWIWYGLAGANLLAGLYWIKQ